MVESFTALTHKLADLLDGPNWKDFLVKNMKANKTDLDQGNTSARLRIHEELMGAFMRSPSKCVLSLRDAFIETENDTSLELLRNWTTSAGLSWWPKSKFLFPRTDCKLWFNRRCLLIVCHQYQQTGSTLKYKAVRMFLFSIPWCL